VVFFLITHGLGETVTFEILVVEGATAIALRLELIRKEMLTRRTRMAKYLESAVP
jgi:hypothetical protein